MEKLKYCKYCNELFAPRRRNHLYCTSSCKTMASYKRNNYKYVAGHYQKAIPINKDNMLIPVTKKVENSITSLEERIQKIDNINVSSVTNAAIGSLAASTVISGAQRVFAPKSLPATKGDVAALKSELNELKMMLRNFKGNKLPY